MLNFFNSISPYTAALLATLFTWFVTALGASLVFFFRKVKHAVMDGFLAFAAGVMIAASFFSLLLPAIEISEEMNVPPYLPVTTGFALGCLFIFFINKISDGFTPLNFVNRNPGLKRVIILILAITLHNIPEGLAVGVAFGAVASGFNGASVTAAVSLAVGIGIQNFPEGAAVSLPLKREKIPVLKCFLLGQASGIVEPMAGLLGVYAVTIVKPVLPYALSFAAGAMIYVVIKELIPEAIKKTSKEAVSLITAFGFVLMMFLDTFFG